MGFPPRNQPSSKSLKQRKWSPIYPAFALSGPHCTTWSHGHVRLKNFHVSRAPPTIVLAIPFTVNSPAIRFDHRALALFLILTFRLTMTFAALLQAHWANIASAYTPIQIILTGNFLVQTLAFWIPALAYLSIDLIPSHPLYKFKIQPAKKVTKSEVWQCIKTVLVNQYLVATPLDLSLALLAARFGHPPALRVNPILPSIQEIVRDFTVSVIVREILFYYSHRLGHMPALYKRIHKMHHKFTAPIAPSAEYAHPIEHLVANVIPVIAGAGSSEDIQLICRPIHAAFSRRFILDIPDVRIN